MKEPIAEDYGYGSKKGFSTEKGGKAYYKALEKYRVSIGLNRDGSPKRKSRGRNTKIYTNPKNPRETGAGGYYW